MRLLAIVAVVLGLVLDLAGQPPGEKQLKDKLPGPDGWVCTEAVKNKDSTSYEAAFERGPKKETKEPAAWPQEGRVILIIDQNEDAAWIKTKAALGKLRQQDATYSKDHEDQEPERLVRKIKAMNGPTVYLVVQGWIPKWQKLGVDKEETIVRAKGELAAWSGQFAHWAGSHGSDWPK